MLTNKQKSTLRSMANSLRPLFQVGKDGVSHNLINTLSDSLEAHELVKLNILKIYFLSYWYKSIKDRLRNKNVI